MIRKAQSDEATLSPAVLFRGDSGGAGIAPLKGTYRLCAGKQFDSRRASLTRGRGSTPYPTPAGETNSWVKSG
jgi:hypothetical protein